MTDADARLKALFAEDEPPARDPLFTTEVMAAIARRAFYLDVAMLSGVTVLGGLVLWACWPVLSLFAQAAGPQLTPIAAGLTLAATAVILLERRVTEAVGLKHG